MNMRTQSPIDLMTSDEADRASRLEEDLQAELEALRQTANRFCINLQKNIAYEIVMTEQLGKDIREVTRDSEFTRDNIRDINNSAFPF